MKMDMFWGIMIVIVTALLLSVFCSGVKAICRKLLKRTQQPKPSDTFGKQTQYGEKNEYQTLPKRLND